MRACDASAAVAIPRLALVNACSWVFVPWEFARFNLLSGGSMQYGQHAWHWNLTQGLPAVLTTLLPLLAAGLLLASGTSAQLQLAALAGWSVAVYSLPAHKEFRFLLPALQLFMPYCGLGAALLMHGSTFPFLSRSGPGGTKQSNNRRPRHVWRCVAKACILLQLPLAAYFLLVHHGSVVGSTQPVDPMLTVAAVDLQSTKLVPCFSVCRAQVQVLQLISETAARVGDTQASVLFLTPCHSTPYTTHVHRPIRMRFLDCSPRQYAAATARLNEEEQEWLALPMSCRDPRDASSQRACFESGPAEFLNAVLGGPPVQRPRMLVGFAPLMLRLAPLLRGFGYMLEARLTNCWIQTDQDSPCELQLWSL